MSRFTPCGHQPRLALEVLQIQPGLVRLVPELVHEFVDRPDVRPAELHDFFLGPIQDPP
jgi:hypothetical protein